MKRLLVILLIFSMFLTACAVQEQSGEIAEELTEDLTDDVAEGLEDVEEAEEELEVEQVEEVTEEELPEEVEEVPAEEAEDDEKLLKVAEGDTVTAFGKTIVIEDIDNYGSLVALRADGSRVKLMQTQVPEYQDGYEYEIVKSTFNEDTMVTLSIRPRPLATNEYYLQKDEEVTVNGISLQQGEVNAPKDGLASAYISLLGIEDNLWVRHGESKTRGNLTLTLVQPFYLYRDAAIWKVVPA